MSKDKGGENVKKSPAADSKKAPSDYQTGNKTIGNAETATKKNKMSKEPIIDFQAKAYVFELKNCAREFGFKTDEGWELKLAARQEKLRSEKNIFRSFT